jgi:hypothetical protein
MISQYQVRSIAYATLAEIKAANGRENEISTCIETETTYRYLTLGSAYAASNTNVLTTGNGGNTRWIGISGKYTTALNEVTYQAKGFVMTIDTSKTSAGSTTNVQFKPHVVATGKYHFWIDWGDGLYDLIASPTDPAWTHTYSAIGIYTVHIEGLFNGFRINDTGDKQKIISIVSFGTGFSCFDSRTFYGATNLVAIPSNPNVADVKTMTSAQYMFYATSLVDLDLTGWDFRNVTTLQGVCYNVTSLKTFTARGCNFAKVTQINDAFLACYSLDTVDLSNINFTLLTTMESLFGSSGLKSVTFDGSTFPALTTMKLFMFNADITSFDFTPFASSPISDLESAFQGCNLLTTVNLSLLNTSAITILRYTFNGCTSLTSAGLSTVNVSNVTTMTGFAVGVTFNTVEYSNALIYWATLPVQTGVTCNMGNSKYNSSAVAARAFLVSTKSWVIFDAGAV